MILNIISTTKKYQKLTKKKTLKEQLMILEI